MFNFHMGFASPVLVNLSDPTWLRGKIAAIPAGFADTLAVR